MVGRKNKRSDWARDMQEEEAMMADRSRRKGGAYKNQDIFLGHTSSIWSVGSRLQSKPSHAAGDTGREKS